MKFVSANVCNKTSSESKSDLGNAIENAIDNKIDNNIHWIYNHVWRRARTPTKNDVEMAIEDIMDDY